MRLTNDDLYLLAQCAISAAYQAGQLIATYAQREVAVQTKDGASSLAAQVVTEVDELSQDIILQVLAPTCRRFDLALLTEEKPDDHTRLHKDFFWCIDPLDGTLPFLERIPGYAVSIALVAHDGTPLLGVLYDPYSRTLYHSIQTQGAWRNQERLILPPPTPSAEHHLLCITDKSFQQDPLYDATLIELERCAQDLGYAGATLKLQGGAAMNACEVLTTPATCYFKFPKPQKGGGSTWDYAATACVFMELGACVSDMHGHPLQLNPLGSTLMNHCGVLYCTTAATRERMLKAYQNLLAH